MKKKQQFQTMLCVGGMCAALGIWGILYPELSMTPDTYRRVVKSTDGEVAEEKGIWDFDAEIYYDILNAPKGSVHFKSRIFKELEKLFTIVKEQ